MERWYVMMKKADFSSIGAKYNISPVIARLIRNRDIIEDEEINLYLNGTIADLYDGMLMKDMDKAVEILSEKIREEKPVRVIGDYDIDGVNAAYILKEGLEGLGADVDTDIPDRIKDGYGLNKMLIDRALDDGIDTIITCDNGIAAAEEITYGRKNGRTVIVTDHHQVPFVEINKEREYLLPQADAVVDPRRPDCEYPFKNLCGAAVAYKLVEALYNVMLRDPEDVDYLMENVAIATVGDVMALKGENRIFVKQGLEMLKRTKNEGLKALIECTGINPEYLNTYDLGFVLGPCINASGRLDTAKRALELLSTRTRRDAVMLAEDLKALNDSRKEMTERGIKEAAEMIETTSLKEDKVFVIYLPDCHESIAGIIAGKIRDRYYRPTIILTKAEDGVKGSGRSTEEYDMFTELCKCQALFTKFGGHRQAAGVSLKEENVQRFRETINSLCTLTEEDLQMKVYIDMQVPFPYLTEDLIEQFQVMEPFGKGNKRPLFAEKDLKVIQPKIVGKNENVLQCILEDKQGNRMKAVYFGDVKTCLKEMLAGKVTAVTYFPSINEYMGRRSIQLTIVNYQKK